MKKRILLLTTVLFFAIAMLAIAAPTFQHNGWTKLADDQYNFLGKLGNDAVLMRLDRPEEMVTAADSRKENPGQIKAGRQPELPEMQFKGLGLYNNQFALNATPVTVDYQVQLAKNGKPEHSLFLRKVSLNGKHLLTAEPNSGSVPVIPAPHGKKYIFTDEHLWMLDAETLTPQQLTRDVVGKYNRSELVQTIINGNDRETPLHWVINPHWNSDGSSISYDTNRGYTSRGMSIWTVDPVSGMEQEIVSAPGGLFTIGWLNTDQIIYFERILTATEDRGEIKRFDTTSGQSETLLGNVRPLAMNPYYLVYRDGLQIYALNFASKTSTLLATPKENQAFDDFASFSPNHQNLLLRARKEKGMQQSILVISLPSMEIRELHGPVNHMIATDPVWIDDTRIMMQGFDWPVQKGLAYSTWIYQF